MIRIVSLIINLNFFVMHDYDNTSYEANGFDMESAYDQHTISDEAYEYDDEYSSEYESEYDDEYENEYDDEFDDEYHDEYEDEFSTGSALSEEEESEMAYELLAINDEQEMDEFLGRLIKRATRGIRKVARRLPFRQIKKGLRRAAKFALPKAGRLVGTYFGGPLGGRIGKRVGRFASNMFEIELEGLSPEDQEFEIAKRYVRFGSAAARNTAKNARRMNAVQATRQGFKRAARAHAPGLLKMPTSRASRLGSIAGASGRWFRKGNKIIIQGV